MRKSSRPSQNSHKGGSVSRYPESRGAPRERPFSDFTNPGAILARAHVHSIADEIAPASAIPTNWSLKVLTVVLLDRASRAGLRPISQRQIASLLGLSHTQVARIIAAAKEDLAT
jgi:hypothetical protein